MTLTFDLDLTLTLRLTFDLDDLKKYIFSFFFILFEVTWRKNVTSYVKTDGRIQTRCSIRNIFQPTRSLYDFRFKSWLKGWFSWLLMCLTLTLTFKGHLIFEHSPCAPLHDWCKFRSDMFINSGDIAHWNMKKLPMLYNGDIRCHGNVCYVFRNNAIFC